MAATTGGKNTKVSRLFLRGVQMSNFPESILSINGSTDDEMKGVNRNGNKASRECNWCRRRET